MTSNNKGFTLIELLIVVAIIGVIVAIAIPNLLNAIQRAKQKRSMADMRAIATGAEAYAVDYNRYPSAAGYALPSGCAWPVATTIGAGTVLQEIQPTYIRIAPLRDGWDNYFLYGVCNSTNQDYMLASYGRNGLSEAFIGGPTTDFNLDIIFCDGQFVQFPEGAQN